MFNGLKNEELVELMERASNVVKALSIQGVTVKSITLASNKPVIRVQPCGYCDQQIHSGRAVYHEFGYSAEGRYRQGQFTSGGCRVVWSESIH
ncbi:hypothetical protein KGP17_05670 [Serratia sp. JSRIV001]|uniref:hypothetical protein n=1 Tax=Serratia sp. JSRIV001 TaxID=2831893 RepID=UPI001CBD043D|nr:hypothetical protein [Serratia sp. JSRIV001]UAN47032.1 hypothetical protein KGP17_05670 [Serratia sp. JSRIV001]